MTDASLMHYNDPQLKSIDSSYEPLTKQFDFKELKDDVNFAIKRYPNATYKGLINKETNKREGFGVMIYDSGRVYEG